MSCLLTERMSSLEIAFSTLMENLSGKGKWPGSLSFATVELPPDSSLQNKALRFEHVVLLVVFSADTVGVIGWLCSVLLDVVEWTTIGLGVHSERAGWTLLASTLFGVLDRMNFGSGVHIGGQGSMLCWFRRPRRLSFLEAENIPTDRCALTNSMRSVSRLDYKVNEQKKFGPLEPHQW